MSNADDKDAPAFARGHGRGTLTAMFDTRDDAEQAVRQLKEAGIDGVRLMPAYEVDDRAVAGDDEQPGFWGGLADWFFPDDDRAVFTEGLRRGAFLVSVDVNEPDHDTALDILDAEGSIDLDERADLWRTEGWDLQTSRPGDPGSVASQNDDLSQGDAGQTDEARRVPAVGSSQRKARSLSPRVRAHGFEDELLENEEFRDDLLPTGHQRTVEPEDREDPDPRSPTSPGMGEQQIFPRGR